MNQKTAIIAGTAVILLGVGAYLATRHSDDAAVSKPTQAASAAPAHAGPTPAEEAAEKAKAHKDREQVRDNELIAKYGESRTNLSRKIAGDVTGLLEDAVAMKEFAISKGSFGGPANGLRRGLGATWDKLAMTDEQKDKAAEAYAGYQARQTEKTKQTIEDLKKNPNTLMSLFLAADSYKRGDTTEEDYKNYQQANASDIEKIVNPLDRKNFEGGQPLRDPEFQTAMAGILEPGQNQEFQTAISEDAKQIAHGSDMDISNLPAMDLEELDGKMTKARKTVSGFRQVMENSDAFQSLGPAIEAQKKAKQEGQ